MNTSRRAYLWYIMLMLLVASVGNAAPRACNVSATNNILTVVWCEVPAGEKWIIQWDSDVKAFGHSALVTHVSLTGEVVFKILMTEQQLFVRMKKL